MTSSSLLLYRLLRPLLFQLPAERAHNLVLRLLRYAPRVPGMRLLTSGLRIERPALATSLASLRLANPVGLAAGLDKDAHALAGLALCGFGFLEAGTVTPRPQPGNPQPRMFRLPADQALINRMGFNNSGASAMFQHLRQQPMLTIPLGINIGKNKDTPNEQAAGDYLRCLQLLAPCADYIAVNVSSPNTPGLRAMASAEPLRELLALLIEERARLQEQGQIGRLPIFVKLAPDHHPAELEAAVAVLLEVGVDGIIATNTTVDRPASLRSTAAGETGGLSGAPLRERANAVLRTLYRWVDGHLPLVGVGGIDGPQAAYERITAGASAVQIYSALIYQGPGLVAHTLLGLEQLLLRDGHTALRQAVGSASQVGVER